MSVYVLQANSTGIVTPCEPCEAGKFKSTEGTEACEWCPSAGPNASYAFRPGATSCNQTNSTNATSPGTPPPTTSLLASVQATGSGSGSGSGSGAGSGAGCSAGFGSGSGYGSGTGCGSGSGSDAPCRFLDLSLCGVMESVLENAPFSSYLWTRNVLTLCCVSVCPAGQFDRDCDSLRTMRSW